jgi:hypothetical protein
VSRPGQPLILSTTARRYVPPIGVTPLVLWDAQTGITQAAGVVSGWADVIRGVALSDNGSTTRPAYSVDSTFFLGRSVVMFDGVNDTLQNLAISPPVSPASSRPYWFCVFRYRAGNGVLFEATDTGNTTALPQIIRTTTLQRAGYAPTVVASDPGTSVHLCEEFLSAAAGTVTFAVDGGTDLTGATSKTDAVATGRLFLGNYLGTGYAQVSIAAIGSYSAELTAAQRRSLRLYYASAWGSP